MITLKWSEAHHEFLARWCGEWCRRSHPGLPPDLLERIDAAQRHVDDPDGEPWPKGEA